MLISRASRTPADWRHQQRQFAALLESFPASMVLVASDTHSHVCIMDTFMSDGRLQDDFSLCRTTGNPKTVSICWQQSSSSSVDKYIQRVNGNILMRWSLSGNVCWSCLHVHGGKAVNTRVEKCDYKTAGGSSPLVCKKLQPCKQPGGDEAFEAPIPSKKLPRLSKVKSSPETWPAAIALDVSKAPSKRPLKWLPSWQDTESSKACLTLVLLLA